MALDTNIFGGMLKEYGFNFYCGIPCSFLKELINYAMNNCDYLMAANEGEAVAICAGAYLGGKKPVFLCQNSGLTNAVSPLTSLNYIFKIPVLGLVSLRGEAGIKDEPQHELMGQITTSLLDLMQIKWEYLSADILVATKQLAGAAGEIDNDRSFYFVVKKGTFREEKLLPPKMRAVVNRVKIGKGRKDAFPLRIEVLRRINAIKDNNTVVLTTTGYTSREFYELGDAVNNFYMVGSMGCVSSLALGLALSKKEKEIVAVDGDGALLMRLGSMATNAYYNPQNMLHLLLDNNAHESTGGQRTTSYNVDFVQIAASLGYENSLYVCDLEELEIYLNNWKARKGLTFMYIKICEDAALDLGRPKIKPPEVKARLVTHLARED